MNISFPTLIVAWLIGLTISLDTNGFVFNDLGSARARKSDSRLVCERETILLIEEDPRNGLLLQEKLNTYCSRITVKKEKRALPLLFALAEVAVVIYMYVNQVQIEAAANEALARAKRAEELIDYQRRMISDLEKVVLHISAQQRMVQYDAALDAMFSRNQLTSFFLQKSIVSEDLLKRAGHENSTLSELAENLKVLVRSCDGLKMETEICYEDRKMQATGTLTEIGHIGEIKGNAFVHVDLDGDYIKTSEGFVAVSNCRLQNNLFSCEYANSTCEVPSGKGCRLRIQDASTADFFNERLIGNTHVIASKEKTFKIVTESSEYEHAMPPSQTLAIEIEKGHRLHIGKHILHGTGKKTVTIRVPHYEMNLQHYKEWKDYQTSKNLFDLLHLQNLEIPESFLRNGALAAVCGIIFFFALIGCTIKLIYFMKCCNSVTI